MNGAMYVIFLIIFVVATEGQSKRGVVHEEGKVV
jgi:hypothetical protein